MGYTAGRKIRREFPLLGDDCWVEIWNPMLVDQETLGIDDINPDPDDKGGASRATRTMAGNVVIDWCVWDVNDESDDAPVLPLPKEDPTVMERVPMPITMWIAKLIGQAVDPS